MNVTWPWFIAAIFFGAFAFAWLALDNRWGNGRTDQLDDDLSRHRTAVNDRLERIEDWIRLLDARARDLPAVNTQEPAEVDTEEFPVAPATVPDGMPLAVQSALIAEQPSHELMTPETAEKQRAARAAFVEEQLAKFNFTGGRK